MVRHISVISALFSGSSVQGILHKINELDEKVKNITKTMEERTD